MRRCRLDRNRQLHPFHIALKACHLLNDQIGVVSVLRGDTARLYLLTNQHKQAWNCAVGVSPKVHDVLRDYCPDKEVRCIPNGVILPQDEDLKKRRAWSLPLRLLFVGRLEEDKGVLRLPLILEECKKRKLRNHSAECSA